jgi:hypothetical protein
MGDKKSPYFSPLSPKERIPKLQSLVDVKGLMQLWVKGQEDRVSVFATLFHHDHLELVVKNSDLNSPLLKEILEKKRDVLGTFKHKGAHYFFKTQISKIVGDDLVLDLNLDFFKSERRQNFRLLTYLIYKVKAEIQLPNQQTENNNTSKGRLYLLKQKSSEQSLFRSFLKLIQGESLPSVFQLNVVDLSTTGFSAYVGQIEREEFSVGRKFSDTQLFFDDTKITIPTTVVVYNQLQKADSVQKIDTYKIGFYFENLPQDLDQSLSQQINKLLKKIDANKNFEEFVLK